MKAKPLCDRQARRATTARAVAAEGRAPSLAIPFTVEQGSNTGRDCLVPDFFANKSAVVPLRHAARRPQTVKPKAR
jgi:hypothetical protein